MSIYLAIFFIIVLIGIFLIFKFTKTNKVSTEKITFFKSQLNKVVVNGSNKEQIIDIDKLYHKFLQEIGYNGTFGEILKQKPSEIGDIQKIWELHKLRNKLVHDFDLLTEGILRKKASEYKSEINILIKKSQ